MTVPTSISHTVQQTQEWLKEVRDNAGLADETEALAVLRAVLQQLRDRLSIAETAQLAAEFPLLIRGIFYEGWQPSHVPDKSIKSQQDFVEGVERRLQPHRHDPERMEHVSSSQSSRAIWIRAKSPTSSVSCRTARRNFGRCPPGPIRNGCGDGAM